MEFLFFLNKMKSLQRWYTQNLIVTFIWEQPNCFEMKSRWNWNHSASNLTNSFEMIWHCLGPCNDKIKFYQQFRYKLSYCHDSSLILSWVWFNITGQFLSSFKDYYEVVSVLKIPLLHQLWQWLQIVQEMNMTSNLFLFKILI